MRIIFIAFLGIFYFYGCGSQTLSTYTLSPKLYKKRVVSSEFKNKSLRVEYPKGIKDTMGTKIYYKNSNLQESYYLYSQWSRSLNRIIMASIVEILQNSNIFKMVVDYSSTADVDFTLESSVYKFEHRLDKGESFADISIEMRLLDATTNKVVKSKLFKYSTPCKSNDAKGFVEASNKSLEKLGEDMINWLES
jgi:cholesterol transport system auxiliary component